MIVVLPCLNTMQTFDNQTPKSQSSMVTVSAAAAAAAAAAAE
jgi:hypothetical protein